MRRSSLLSLLALFALAATLVSREPAAEARLKKASRAAQRNGWIQVHLEGSPSDIGFQHGYLLAPEINDAFQAVSTEMKHDYNRNWDYFREIARDVFLPRVETEYRDEMAGIVEGLRARGVKLDLLDITMLNAWLELPYYVKQQGEPSPAPGDHCSAFVATGSYTRDGRVVIGHNNWTTYNSGSRWNVIFDIVPERGNRILMDGMPGLIHSGDDFGLNAAGLAITETTITAFHGFDSAGIPEFVRARKAMQYANSIDDFARIMTEGNNGGYANNWLIADARTNEIASLELGLKNVVLRRSTDGFFVGANFPVDPKLTQEETDFDPTDRKSSANARHERWLELMASHKGALDAAAGRQFLADHYDSFEAKIDPDERTLCGHGELSPRGTGSWQPPFSPAGAVQNKVADSAGIGKMEFTAAMGHACGIGFKAKAHLRAHPEFGWQKSVIRDLESRPWTPFTTR